MAKVINVEVRIRKGETVDRLIRRFIKKTKKEKIIDEFTQHLYYEKPSDKKRREKKRIKALIKKEREKSNNKN